MYHILVVDDEKLMRTYLANSIPSFTDKFQVNGIAKDGLEAIELLKKQHFEVVITDIKMPEVDGLSLAKYIADNFPDIIVIIISGYNDFEYARSAIQYRVTDYLLKPLVDQNLILLLESIARRLEKQPASAFLSGESVSTEQELKKALFGSILEGNTALTYDLFQRLESCGLSCPASHHVLLKCLPDTLELLLKNRTAFDVTADHLRLNQLLQDICADFGYTTLYNTDGATYILLTASDLPALTQNIHELHKELCRRTAAENMPKNLVYGSPCVKDIMELPYALQEINRLAPLSLLRRGTLYLSCDTAGYDDFIRSMHALEEQFYTDYLTCSPDRIYLDIGKMLSLFFHTSPDSSTGSSSKDQNRDCPAQENFAALLRLGSYLIQIICKRAKINPAYRRSAYTELFHQIDLHLPSGMPDEAACTLLLSNTICTLIPSSKAPAAEPGEIVTKAKEYILAHYQENISLSDVAAYCGINSSYLSDLFHKTLKESYTKYLLRIRMEQAARLLRQNPNIRVYTVAEQTGFVSVKHFNTVFKKYYGVTPKEF